MYFQKSPFIESTNISKAEKNNILRVGHSMAMLETLNRHPMRLGIKSKLFTDSIQPFIP
jgi:hydroxylamine reductase (hybrid-cluster protein)